MSTQTGERTGRLMMASAIARVLPVGARSVLYGAHCWFLHPWFVAVAWTRLYGFPYDPRLWLAFFVHDLGYLMQWCPNMDGPEGEAHVVFGAGVMGLLCGPRWADFCRYHSRYYARRDGRPYSRLCVADKLAIALTPAWLYLPLARLSGELDEYIALAAARSAAGEPKYASARLCTTTAERWYADVQEYLRRWVAAHRDGRPDEWTPRRAARGGER